MGYTIDIDTGGTFTDGFFTCGDRAEIVKVPTTPHDLTVCFLECIVAGAQRFGVAPEDLLHETEIVRFSNTIGTNTIIQRDGSKVGLLVTAGAEGLAPTAAADQKPPLVFPDMVLGVAEQMSPDGRGGRAPNDREVLAAAQRLIDRGASCLAVAFTHSDRNPHHEELARQAIKREYPRDYLGSVPVFLSSNISPRAGDVERVNAVVLNAYIHQKLVQLLYKAGEDLRRRLYRQTLFIGHSNGAVARVARTRAINTYNSGPTAGLMGARVVGELYGAAELLSADMGGTSYDLGYVRHGQPSYDLRPDVEGFAVNVPMLGIRAIGAGGGSIATVAGGALRVGPQSAGALPGPACFGLGGTAPTVTDADLVLGVLDPGYFLGGRMRLSRDKAAAALQTAVAGPLGVSVEEAALRVKQAVDRTMGEETRRLKEDAGLGASPLLVVYGGAGAAHCCDVARWAGVRRIVITPFSAVFSAFGSSTMDVGHVYSRRAEVGLAAGADLTPLAEAVSHMVREAERDFRGEGFTRERVALSLELLVRPAAGGAEVRVPAEMGFHETPAGVRGVAERAREALGRGGAGSSDGLWVTTVSLVGQAPIRHYPLRAAAPAGGDSRPARKGFRPVFLDAGRGSEEVAVYDRGRLGPGHRVSGPALVESETTTILVQGGWQLTVDEYQNCLLEEVTAS
ncbi:MAG: hydantoinase/oxoprolinase family protein [Deferrisomatales bacterium]